MASILLLTDYSNAALNAAAFGVRLFGPRGNRYTLLHSHMVAAPADPLLIGMPPELEAGEPEELRELVERLRTEVGMPELDVRTEMIAGTLPSAIDILHKEDPVDAVVMSAGTGDGADQWFFGSDVAAVVKNSRVPVVVVPDGATFKGLKHVLLAADDGDIVPGAFNLLIDLVRRDLGRLTIVNVEDPEHPSTAVNGDLVLHAMLGDLQHAFITVHGTEVSEAIDGLARANQVDLVVALHRHEGWLRRSTAKQLALRTRLPLLVLQQ